MLTKLLIVFLIIGFFVAEWFYIAAKEEKNFQKRIEKYNKQGKSEE